VFGKLASMFVDTESDRPKAPSKPPEAPVSVAPKPVVPIIPGQPDPEMAQIIQEAIEKANLPGFDYIEFRDSLVRMAGVPMTEEQKFQAVFATAQSMGVTKQVLLDAVDHYLKVVAAQATEFESYVNGVESQQVTVKEKSVADLTTTIEGEAAEINRLTMSIQEHRKQQDAINLEIVQAKQDIQNKRSAFEATRAAIANNLTSDRTKIETYLK
jgi:hypothetical protein